MINKETNTTKDRPLRRSLFAPFLFLSLSQSPSLNMATIVALHFAIRFIYLFNFLP